MSASTGISHQFIPLTHSVHVPDRPTLFEWRATCAWSAHGQDTPVHILPNSSNIVSSDGVGDRYTLYPSGFRNQQHQTSGYVHTSSCLRRTECMILSFLHKNLYYRALRDVAIPYMQIQGGTSVGKSLLPKKETAHQYLSLALGHTYGIAICGVSGMC